MLFAVCGVVNTFNMVDGLLGDLYCVFFPLLGILFYQNTNVVLAF
ncbi:MAG: hypothetical protein ACTS85_00725 [Arsenophonus sp. NC-PG7-MAG3]